MSECIIWHKAISARGYGAAFYNGKYIGAHRLAWIKANGDIPQGMYVCHKCDVPSCVNPDHLFLGTPLDNMRDMIDKGRQKVPINTKVINGMKPCNRCNAIKPLADFSPSSVSKSTGTTIYRPACKSCRRK